ncbi:MAG: carbohydrate ABC transporter permease [Candidatus Zixiibacteriota bacterium]
MQKQPKRIVQFYSRNLPIVVMVVIIILVALGPFLLMLITSIRFNADINYSPFDLWSGTYTFENYLKLLSQTNFLEYASSSILVATIVALISGCCAILASYGITRIRSRLSPAVMNLSLWGYLFSPIMLVIPSYVLLGSIGLVDTYFGLILTQLPMALALSFWVTFPFLRDLPPDIEDTAALDGASLYHILILIVAPIVRPALLAASAFSFLFSWNEYLTARVLMSGPRKTLPVGLQDIYDSTVVDWGMLMAACVLIVVPVLAMYFALQRFYVDDWGVGGIKG